MSTTQETRLLRYAAEQYGARLAEALGDRLISVVLFGSVARGEASAKSDIDLLIVARDLPSGQFARKRHLEQVDRAFEAERLRIEAKGVEVRLARIMRTPQEAQRVIPLYLDL